MQSSRAIIARTSGQTNRSPATPMIVPIEDPIQWKPRRVCRAERRWKNRYPGAFVGAKYHTPTSYLLEVFVENLRTLCSPKNVLIQGAWMYVKTLIADVFSGIRSRRLNKYRSVSMTIRCPFAPTIRASHGCPPSDMVSYYQTILSRAHSVSPALVADEALFQSLLVVLVAKQKHLLIRTADDDIPRVMKQIVNVSSTR